SRRTTRGAPRGRSGRSTGAPRAEDLRSWLPPVTLQNRIQGDILDAKVCALFLRLRLKQTGCWHVNPCAGILHQQYAETLFPQVPRREETADVRRDATDDDIANPRRPQQRGQGRVLRCDRIGVALALEALAPDGMEPLRVQARQEVCAQRTHHTVGWIQVVALPQEAAMVWRVPVLAGIDAGPG